MLANIQCYCQVSQSVALLQSIILSFALFSLLLPWERLFIELRPLYFSVYGAVRWEAKPKHISPVLMMVKKL